MPALVLGGITVPCLEAQRAADELVGDRSRSMLGTAQDSIRARKRVWSVSAGPMTQTDAEALRALGVGFVTGSGDLLGASLTVAVEAGAAEVVPHWVGGVWVSTAEVLSLVIREA